MTTVGLNTVTFLQERNDPTHVSWFEDEDLHITEIQSKYTVLIEPMMAMQHVDVFEYYQLLTALARNLQELMND